MEMENETTQFNLLNKRAVRKFLMIVATMGCLSFSLNAQTEMSTNLQLTAKQQSIIPIAAYTAIGELQDLKSALNSGLDAGLSISQIKEVMVHLYAYCGFPRSIRGLQTFMEVLDERKAKGINDVLGKEASPIQEERSKYERGSLIIEKLTGTPQDGPKTGYSAFAPEIDVFLKEYLFADIFERDVLTYSERELVTISVISSIGGAEPMLRAHMNICLNVGLTPEQLNQFVKIIKSIVGKKEAKATQKVLDEVLEIQLKKTK
jgi:4-carboxymuconolactone decarboxylase